MDDNIELTHVIARLRRAQPRNADTQVVCDELERRLVNPHAGAEPSASPQGIGRTVGSIPATGAKDRKTYMRDLMRKRRAAAKAGNVVNLKSG